MVARSEKKSAADLCVCGHWRREHADFDDAGRTFCATHVPDAAGIPTPCPCPGFRQAVHPAELTKGAKS